METLQEPQMLRKVLWDNGSRMSFPKVFEIYWTRMHQGTKDSRLASSSLPTSMKTIDDLFGIRNMEHDHVPDKEKLPLKACMSLYLPLIRHNHYPRTTLLTAILRSTSRVYPCLTAFFVMPDCLSYSRAFPSMCFRR